MEQGIHTITMNMIGYMEVIPFNISQSEFTLISEILAWLRSDNFGSFEIIKIRSNGREFIDIQITERKRITNV